MKNALLLRYSLTAGRNRNAELLRHNRGKLYHQRDFEQGDALDGNARSGDDSKGNRASANGNRLERIIGSGKDGVLKDKIRKHGGGCMKITVKTVVYVNCNKISQKAATAKYKGLSDHIRHLRNVSRSVAQICDNGVMTSSQEFDIKNGDKVRVEISTMRYQYQ